MVVLKEQFFVVVVVVVIYLFIFLVMIVSSINVWDERSDRPSRTYLSILLIR